MYQESTPASAIAASPVLSDAEIHTRSRHLFESGAALAAILDHTLLKPQATEAQVLALCAEAARYGFSCAMVNPAWVPTASAALAGTGIRVGTVIGFPLGASLPVTKQQEALATARAGALDLDMVLNIGALCSGRHEEVAADVRGVAEVAHGEGAILKVILETCLLTDEQKRTAAELCLEAGADFLKTSTGFSTGGATVEDIRLLRSIAGTRSGVKASGGIRTLSDTVLMVEAGANRVGASASVAIVKAFLSLLPQAS